METVDNSTPNTYENNFLQQFTNLAQGDNKPDVSLIAYGTQGFRQWFATCRHLFVWHLTLFDT